MICSAHLQPASCCFQDQTSFSSDFIIHDSGERNAVLPTPNLRPVEDLLTTSWSTAGSRYCETDRMMASPGRCLGYAAGMGARAGDPRLRCMSGSASAISTRAADAHGVGSARRAPRRVPRLCAPRHHAVPLHDVPGALLQPAISATSAFRRRRADGFQRLGSKRFSMANGAPSMRAQTRRGSADPHRARARRYDAADHDDLWHGAIDWIQSGDGQIADIASAKVA